MAAQACAQNAPKPDSAPSSSGTLENKRVRVSHISVAPQEELALPKLEFESVLISLHSATLSRRPNFGDAETFPLAPGGAFWNRGGASYWLTNLGETPAELLVIELKDSYASNQISAPGSERDPVYLDARHFRAELENEHVRVMQVHLDPRDATEEVQLADRLEIAISGVHKNISPAGAATREDRRSAGSITWEKNILATYVGDFERPIDEVVVELKHPFCYEAGPAQISQEMRDAGLAPYVTAVNDKIHKKWSKSIPHSAKSGTTGMVAVQFVVDRDGIVAEDSISFHLLFADNAMAQAALNAVRSAGPFAPLPEFFKGPHMTMHFTFVYNLPTTRPAYCE